MVYKCPKCKILNKLNENARCQNYFTQQKICKFDIEKANDDEADQLDFHECTEHEYKLKITEWELANKNIPNS